MKHKIQQRQRRRLKGMPPAEESRIIQKEISKHPELARLWKTAPRSPVRSGYKEK